MIQNTRIPMCLVAAGVLVLTGGVYALTHFKDGGTHAIDHTINNSVYVDEGDAYAQTQTTINIVDGAHIPRGENPPWNYVRAYNQGAVSVTGGSVELLWTYNDSAVSIAGGRVGTLWAYDLHSDSENRINITGGRVRHLYADIELVKNEHFSFSGLLSDLAGYGVQAVAGTVDNIHLGRFFAGDNSSVAIVAGSVSYFVARGSSRVAIIGGQVDALGTSCSSSVAIVGGSVRELDAMNSSTVAIAAGSVDRISHFRGRSLAIAGGSVGTLDIGGGTGDSTVTIAGGSIHLIRTSFSSSVAITGGSIDHLGTSRTSRANIAGGRVGQLRAFGDSTVTFLAKAFILGEGLSLSGDGLVGTGTLFGQWLDGTEWTTKVTRNDETATIVLIPVSGSTAIAASCQETQSNENQIQ